MSNYILKKGKQRFKPELVAPGDMIVAANSDGNRFTKANFGVQCGMRSKIKLDASQCTIDPSVLTPDYSSDAALNVMSGTSVSAALIAGAAAIIRQYLAEGYYPEGFKDSTNTVWAMPSASLVTALLVNSARTTGGTVNVYTFLSEPPCTSETGECPPWVQPPPVISTVGLRAPNGEQMACNSSQIKCPSVSR